MQNTEMLWPRWLRLSLRLPADLVFWAALLLLNVVLFLPAYLMTQESSSLLPAITEHRDLWGWLSAAAISRPNLDLFRLNLELFLFATLWIYVKPFQRGWVRWLFVSFYLLAFIYAIYEGISLFIYFADPVIYSQTHMITAGLPFLLQTLRLPVSTYLGVATAVIVFIGAVYWLAKLMTEQKYLERLSRATRTLVPSISGIMLFLLIGGHGQLGSPEMVVSSFIAKLEQNFAKSMVIYKQVHSYDDSAILKAYDYTDKTLVRKPNIYLIFIESYGSVLYKRKDWAKSYPALLEEVERDLDGAGWHMASALSDAPVWGGGSWMAYTSALFGLRIENDAQYLSMLDTYRYRDYPHLGNYFREQGYQYVWLTPIAASLSDEKNLHYQQFYNIDRWLRFADLNYSGPMVSFGPAPLDQYSINFARETLLAESVQPFLFYTLTQNSHYPWYELPPLAEDWRTLNDPSLPQPDAPPELIDHEVRRANYFNTIRYQMEMLSDFIRNEEAEDSIFILVGDHQPPQVSRREDGWDTPIHIVSRDPEFVASFMDYGFEPGLKVENSEPVMRHEGLYSLLVRILLKHHGAEDVTLPAYLPNGLPFDALPVEPLPVEP
jgi:hypothetical protein